MNAELLRHSIRGLRYLPVQPGAAAACLSALRADGADALPLVADSVAIDPGLTALFLREGRASTVEAALRSLGHDGAVRLTAEAARHTLDNPRWLSNPMLAVLWKHAIAASTLARAAAERLAPGHAPRAGAAGLLHDIGKLALFAIAPDTCKKAQEDALAQGASLLEAEKRAFGATHALAGKWLAEAWSLPPAIVHAIWLHHQPLHRLAPVHGDARLTDLVRLGNALAHAHGSGEPTLGAALVPDLLLERLELERGELAGLLRTAAAIEIPQDAHGADRLRGLLERVRPAADGDVAGSERDELNRLRRIEALHATVSAASDTEDALAAIVEHVFAQTEADEVFVVWRFHVEPYFETVYARRGEPLAHALQAHDDPVRAIPPFEIFAGALGRSASEWRAVAILADGDRMGWLAIDAAHGDDAFLDETASHAAPLLARLRDTAAARWEAESLSEVAVLQQDAPGAVLPREAQSAAPASHDASRLGETIVPLLDSMLSRTQALRKRLEYTGDQEEAAAVIDLCHRARLTAASAAALARPCAPDLHPALINVELRKIVGRHRERLTAKGFRLIERFGDGLPQVRLDAGLFAHAIECLLHEAEEGITGSRAIAIETATPSDRSAAIVRIAFPADGHDPAGASFAPGHPERVQPGVALAAARHIVSAHGGAFTTRISEGECIFSVSIPEAKAELRAPAPPSPERQKAPAALAKASAGESPSILVIDDDEDLLEILRASLHLRGYRVALARGIGSPDGDDAEPGLILVDYPLTDASGGDALATIAARYPAVPIIAMTAGVGPAERAALRGRGVRACIEKPFSIPALLAEVAETLTTGAAGR